MGAQATIFLDRDGVLVEERGYLTSPRELKMLPGAATAVKELRARGFRVVVVSNQSAVARGFMDEAALSRMHEELHAQLATEGASLDGLYSCPHHPESAVAQYRLACDCRKPSPGMLQRASVELGLALDRTSFMVGDQLTDLRCAAAAGVRPVLVRTGKGRDVELVAREEFPLLNVVDSILDVPGLVGQKQALQRPSVPAASIARIAEVGIRALEESGVACSVCRGPMRSSDARRGWVDELGVKRSLYACSSCGGLQAHPPPTVPARFPHDSRAFVAARLAGALERVALWRLRGLLRGPRVLAVGAGARSFALAGKTLGLSVTPVAEGTDTLPQVPAELFDEVISLQGVEYASDPHALIGALRDCVKPGGRVLVSTTNAVATARHAWEEFAGPSGPRRLLTDAGLSSLAASAGLSVEQVASSERWDRNRLADGGLHRIFSAIDEGGRESPAFALLSSVGRFSTLAVARVANLTRGNIGGELTLVARRQS